MWDNISGPRAAQIWSDNSNQSSTLEQLPRYSLNGEMVDIANSKSIKKKLKFMVLPKYFSTSMVFDAYYNDQITKFSLSLLWEKSLLQKYLMMNHIVEDRMNQLTEVIISITHDKDISVALDILDEGKMESILVNLDQLLRNQMSEQGISRNFQNSFYMMDNGSDILARVLTSHLQTGCTLVIGESEEHVIRWVDTISMFIFPAHRILFSRYISTTYIPDMILQGMVATEVDDEIIINSSIPTTLLDLNHDPPKIDQTYPYHAYSSIRSEFFEDQIKSAANIPRRENLLVDWDRKGGLYPPRRTELEISPLVQNIVDGIFELPSCPSYLREGYITHTMDMLINKSIVLINYITSLQERKTDQYITDEMQMNEQIDHREIELVRMKRWIIEMLHLEESCYRVLLSIAEKIQPGIYLKAEGNPSKAQDRLLELFGRF
eukprot:TRINITY_DN2044_c3_g1_i2.p1 TRINITY_DN2044_c3_g1~~TRINITY_DN2044_c3_g1_i2.p1  ORF type:complete len:435 (-),score=88.83 TRINITY_DN2044_c3_g1_i2:55-1359(-)